MRIIIAVLLFLIVSPIWVYLCMKLGTYALLKAKQMFKQEQENQ